MPRVVHFEIHVDDPERARKFYEETFGWQFSQWPGGSEEYWLIKTGEPNEPGIDGGMMRRRDPRGNVYNTIQVDNLDASLKQVESLGGKPVVPKMPIPGVGWLAYCQDTEGNVFGILQPDQSAK